MALTFLQLEYRGQWHSKAMGVSPWFEFMKLFES